MQFAKLLKDYASPLESHDDGSRDFVSYKRLKKLLKAAAELREQKVNVHIPQGTEIADTEEVEKKTAGNQGVLKHVNEKDGQIMCEFEQEFVIVLREDVERINTYFMEQEESSVIKLQDLVDRYEKLQPEKSNSNGSCSAGDVERLRSQFVDLHGELVLLLHWSIVNYAGVLKILKKHDKMLGGHAQKQLMNSVLHQPFTSTESINQLVNTAENYVRRLASDDSANSVDVNQILEDEGIECESLDPARSESEGRQQTIIKRTRAALGMLTQLQSTAHSPSTLIQVEKFPVTQQLTNDSVLGPKRPRVS